MSMKEGLGKWLDTKNEAIKEWIPAVKRLSDKDEVQGLIMQMVEDYENKKIDEAELLGSIANMAGKTLDEIEQILANPEQVQEFPVKSPGAKEYQYKTWLGDPMDNQIWEKTTRKDWLDPITDSPWYIIVPNAQTKANRYIPVNPNDPAWPPILAELDKQTRRRV